MQYLFVFDKNVFHFCGQAYEATNKAFICRLRQVIQRTVREARTFFGGFFFLGRLKFRLLISLWGCFSPLVIALPKFLSNSLNKPFYEHFR